MKKLYLLCILLVLSCAAHSEDVHLIKHVEALSRDYFYIDLSRSPEAFSHESVVGGEHEKHYYILGFEGDIFRVKIYALSGDAGYVPRGDDYKILSTHQNKAEKLDVYMVEVIGQQAWIDVSFSAYPFAEYQLKVEKTVK